MSEDILSPATGTEVTQGNENAQPAGSDVQEGGKTIPGGATSFINRFIQESSDEIKDESKVEDENKGEEVKTPETKTTTEEVKSPEGGEAAPPFKKWEEMNQSELIDKAKTFQSRYDKTKAELDKLASALNEREEILRTIFQDPVEAFKKIAPELTDVLELNRPIEKTLESWQQAVLLPELQKEFPNVVTEDWQPDPSEMYNPMSPTYKFITKTMDKDKELRNRQAMAAEQRVQNETVSREMEQVVIKNNLDDKKYLIDQFGLTEQQLQDFAAKYDQMVAQTDPNNPYPEWHPNRIKNIIKATFFDDIMAVKVEKAVNEAVNKVHQEYKLKGITIPGKQMPVDVTQIPSKDTSAVNSQNNNKTVFGKLFGNI
ncbi:MAG: hypothetical protein WC549_01880 [Actinomycetota bacterium]